MQELPELRILLNVSSAIRLTALSELPQFI